LKRAVLEEGFSIIGNIQLLVVEKGITFLLEQLIILLWEGDDAVLLAIFQTLFQKKNKVEDIVFAIQAGNEEQLNHFLMQYELFILKIASKVCRRFITKQDDEFSVALQAFHESIQSYSYKKGSSFLSFASLVVKRRIIDYIREESKHRFLALDEGIEEFDNSKDDYGSYEMYCKNIDDLNRKEEIKHYSELLRQFGLSFSDLVCVSPKHIDTRNQLFNIVHTFLLHEEMVTYLFKKKKLPIKQMEEMTTVSRKTLEKHRKYIIALCVVFLNDFPYIQSFLKRGNS